MTIILDEVQRPEPDLTVIRLDDPDDPDDLNRTFYRGEDVSLVIELISQDTRPRDTRRKPLLYAEARIPHFWPAEMEADRLLVRVHELDPATGSSICTGVHHSRLKLAVSFDADIDLTLIDRMKRRNRPTQPHQPESPLPPASRRPRLDRKPATAS